MKIKLLIATDDNDYAEHLSQILVKNHSDVFDVIVCSSAERLRDLLTTGRFDAALLEPGFASEVNLNSVLLPLELTDEFWGGAGNSEDLRKIRKYQRVSSLAGDILEYYAEVATGMSGFFANQGKITAVWSPSGGSGKTTVALAYAAAKVSEGKQALYLNLENFSSISAFFQENGRSISKAFEKMESNLHLFLQGIRQKNSDSGIMYFCSPDNYDDINKLETKDVESLLNACVAGIDDLIVDLSSSCDERVQMVFAMADTVFIVCDPSAISQVKLKQFIEQHSVFAELRRKAVIVSNKGAKTETAAVVIKEIQLPSVQSVEPVSVLEALSGSNIPW